MLQFFDYFYTDEGYLLANYGIEGESYDLIDGVPTWSDYIMNNPDGELDLASTWDAHVADIISMDIETCLEDYQAAYDRYMAR